MVSKVEPSLKSSIESQSQESSAAQDTSFFCASTITSMSQKIGIGFIQCLAFLFVQGCRLVSHCSGKKNSIEYQPPRFESKNYDLRRYGDFEECFEKDPAQALNTLLDLLDKSPETFKGIILDVIKKTKKPSRAEIIMKIEDVFFGLLASPELLFHKHRVNDLLLTEKEALWLTGNEESWDPNGKDIEVIATRGLQKKCEETMSKSNEIWKKCLTFIGCIEDLDTLKLLNKDCYMGKGEVDIKLGDFLERLHFTFGFGVLTSRKERFDPLMNGIIQVLGYLKNDTEFDLNPYPKFQHLVIKAHKLLLLKKNQDTLFELAQTIITESSPSKRRISDSSK